MKWIFSPGGGVMPFVIERFLAGSQAEIVPEIITKGPDFAPPKKLPQGTLAEIRKMHFDTAQTSNPVAMGALRQVVPVSQIPFGTGCAARLATVDRLNFWHGTFKPIPDESPTDSRRRRQPSRGYN